jgi:hypothetical protein
MCKCVFLGFSTDKGTMHIFSFRVGAGGEDASNGKSAVGDRQIEAKPDTLTVDTGAEVPFHQIF